MYLPLDKYFDIPLKKEEKWRFSPIHTYTKREYKSSLHVNKDIAIFKDEKSLYTFEYKESSYIESDISLHVKSGVCAEVILYYTGGVDSFVSQNLAIELEPHATLKLYQSYNLSDSCVFISEGELSIQNSATFSSFSFLIGGEYTHSFMDIVLEDRSQSDVTSLIMAKNEQKMSFTSTLRHAASNAYSSVMSKQVLHDKSIAVVDVLTTIDKDTKASIVKQGSHALLLGEKAQIHAKPHLEILSEDLSASHGCTVGELDSSAIDYLCLRGIPEDKAKQMLIMAFINEIIEACEMDAAKENIYTLLRDYYEYEFL